MIRAISLLVVVTAVAFSVACEREKESSTGKEPSASSSTATGVTAGDVTDKAGEAASAAAAYSKKKAEEFRRELEDKLADLDKKIDAMKERGSELSEQAKKEWQEQMDAVAEQRKALRSMLDELGAASAEAWGDVKTGAQKAWNDLQAAYNKAAERFGSESSSSNSP